VFIVVRIIWPKLQIDAITIGLLAVAFLPWLSTLIESAKLPGGYEITFRRIEAKQEQQQSEVERLRFVVSHLLTKWQVDILGILAQDKSLTVENDPYRDFFIMQLRDLLDREFIDRVEYKSFSELVDLLKRGNKVDVRAYVKITGAGRKYLELRDQSDSETSVQNDGS